MPKSRVSLQATVRYFGWKNELDLAMMQLCIFCKVARRFFLFTSVSSGESRNSRSMREMFPKDEESCRKKGFMLTIFIAIYIKVVARDFIPN